ncbi:hypothetical protein TNIN_317761 [Trichonephila inaurata madagascariensis]|uniref:Uncharacterized protein n=1 Tax=Trichonephila inaurata madagascariensis TaxID=2747483 RepID=A0A8X7CNM3_9ARAC|nr:hypothetical protein TNIN_317761 [Trichonephila inaurata madagascariensis]
MKSQYQFLRNSPLWKYRNANLVLNDLGLYHLPKKKQTELLASRLYKDFLLKGAKVSYFQLGESVFLQCFRSDGGLKIAIMYMEELRISVYNGLESLLFINRSKSSLECAFLYNRN